VTKGIGAFSFEKDGRTYTCRAEACESLPSGDTERSIRARIAAFYERRLWARAQRAVPHQSFGRPGRPTVPAKR